jgi:hypothetical protein
MGKSFIHCLGDVHAVVRRQVWILSTLLPLDIQTIGCFVGYLSPKMRQIASCIYPPMGVGKFTVLG